MPDITIFFGLCVEKRLYPCARAGNDDAEELARQKREKVLQQQADLASRIASGEFTVGAKRYVDCAPRIG